MPGLQEEPAITLPDFSQAGKSSYHAQAKEQGVMASLTLSSYSPIQGGYAIGHQYVDHVALYGRMGEKQKAQAQALLETLKLHVKERLLLTGWQVVTQTPRGEEVWRYVGPEVTPDLVELASRIWRGRYERRGPEKFAPNARLALESEQRARYGTAWHAAGLLEFSLTDEGMRVRSRRPLPASEERVRVASQQTISILAPARSRTLKTRRVTFFCAWCKQPVTQERFPGPRPRYCSDTCKEAAAREKTRERVRRWRSQHDTPS